MDSALRQVLLYNLSYDLDRANGPTERLRELGTGKSCFEYVRRGWRTNPNPAPYPAERSRVERIIRETNAFRYECWKRREQKKREAFENRIAETA